jgi:glyoxylase-like metal-dependent hydrolase (beta-lactamase superfamily II)
MADKATFHDTGFNITCIDTELSRPGLAACYLIEHKGMAGFVDTGVNSTVPLLLDVLARKRIPVENVAYVMPTHVHLDHAGGAGALMEQLPNAHLLIHPRGARHLIDPQKLEAGAMAVYGEESFRRLYGELVPIAAERVTEVSDGYTLDFNGRTLRFFDTPGHAKHHYCIHDELSEGLFTGDTFGASYPELNGGRQRFIFPPTTPIQFDPQAWHSTLSRLMELQPKRIFVTHYGKHENLQPLLNQLRGWINEYVDLAHEYADRPQRQSVLRAALMQASINTLLDSGCTVPISEMKRLLAMDMELNAQGLDYWLGHYSPVAGKA